MVQTVQSDAGVVNPAPKMDRLEGSLGCNHAEKRVSLSLAHVLR